MRKFYQAHVTAPLLAIGVGMSGCSSGLFNTEPMFDTTRDAQGHVILLDTPRMWDDWERAVDLAVASELRGDSPPGGIQPSWNTYWLNLIEINQAARANPSKYIAYIIDVRRKFHLPELNYSSRNE